MKTLTHLLTSKLFILLMALLLAVSPVFSQAQPARAANCTVTNSADSGEGTLRALLADTACDTIDFDSDMSIHLASPLWIDTGRTITIDGAGHTVSITDDNFRRVITVASGADVTLQNITIIQGSMANYFVDAEGSIPESSMIPNFGTLKINNSTITGNPTMPARMVGGGILNRGTLMVNRSTFTGHSALGGGAIYNDGYMSDGLANLFVTNSTFANNTSWVKSAATVWTGMIGGGGAITNCLGTLMVTGSTFSGNTAEYTGGAIDGNLGVNTITNNTFTGNMAVTNGGAVMLMGGTLTNNTFSGSSASIGSALFVQNQSPMEVTLSNNLVVKGAIATGANCHFETPDGFDPGTISGSNNLADDGSCGSGFTNIPTLSTQIGALGDNGGSTLTIPLLAGSGAIDAGDDSQCPIIDQRGMTRPQGAACDVGAYEFEIPSDYTISGVVYEDLNENGTRDAGEMGVDARVILAIRSDQGPFNPWYSAVAAADGSYAFAFPTTHPEGLSFSVYVEHADGIRITQTPAPFAYPTGNLTGMDIGLHIIVLTPIPSRFPDGVQGVFYNQTITLTGGEAPYTFTPTTSWSIPDGLSYAFDPQAGAITLSGMPTEAGTFLTRADIKDAAGAFGQIWEDFSIHPPMQYSPENLPDGSLNAPYNQTIQLTGGLAPYTFVRYGGEQWLPTGLALDTTSANIVITGTPTEAGEVILDVYFKDQTGTEIEIQSMFWIKTEPSLTLTSSLNPSLQSQEVTFSLGSTATVAHWPAPWGQVTFVADGIAIPGCEGLWLGLNPETEETAPNPVTCATSSLAVGSHTITAALTILYGPYNSATATLQGGQTVNADVPQYRSGGFTPPVDLGGVLNTAKAGQMIPLKWRLLDAAGNPVTNLDPASVMLTVSSYACQAGVPTDSIETYASGATGLQNLGNGYYQLNWKTLTSYASTCRQITLKIGSWTGDGFIALFQFKK